MPILASLVFCVHGIYKVDVMNVEKEILKLAKKSPGITIDQASDHLEVSQEEITKSASNLQDKGKIIIEEGNSLHLA